MKDTCLPILHSGNGCCIFHHMRNILKDVQEGKFAKDWLLENQAGRTYFNAKKQIESEHEMEKAGAVLRGLMSWMKKPID